MNAGFDQLLRHFTAHLDRLKDWPDKNIITELTAITEHNINLAQNFAFIIVSKLGHESTFASYKLPLFYLIDSIMKHVGGPYAALFGKLLGESYPRALKDLHEKDRGRLDFLLGTWEERKILPLELLDTLKRHLRSQTVSFLLCSCIYDSSY